MTNKHTTITREYPVWIVPVNAVWTIPENFSEIRFETPPDPPRFGGPRSIRGLAIEHAPGDVYTHVYFHATRGHGGDRSAVSTAVLGVHDVASAAVALGLAADAIHFVSVWKPEPSHRATIYGVRSMTHLRESGHDYVGQVSINGRKRRAFTSSALMRTPDGPLVNVAVLYICPERATCVHCGQSVDADGAGTLIDPTGGDVCGARSANTVGDNLPHETSAS